MFCVHSASSVIGVLKDAPVPCLTDRPYWFFRLQPSSVFSLAVPICWGQGELERGGGAWKAAAPPPFLCHTSKSEGPLKENQSCHKWEASKMFPLYVEGPSDCLHSGAEVRHLSNQARWKVLDMPFNPWEGWQSTGRCICANYDKPSIRTSFLRQAIASLPCFLQPVSRRHCTVAGNSLWSRTEQC